MASFPVTPPVQTPGVNDVYEYCELYLDSNSRDSGTNDKPRFFLAPILHNILGIKVISAQVPFTYYVFQPTNNTFTLTDNAGAATNTVVIPPGNYNATTICTQLGASLTTASGGHATYTAAYNNTTGAIAVTSSVTEAFVLHFGADINDKGWNNPRLWLGFAAGSNTATSAGVLTAPSVACPTGPTYIYLESSLGGRIAKNIRVNGSTTNDPAVIARIPVNVNPWGVINYTDTTESFAFDMDDGFLQEITVSLSFGDSGQALSLNGSPWGVVLQVLVQRTTSISKYSKPDSNSPMLALPSKRLRIC